MVQYSSLTAIGVYILILFSIGLLSYRKKQTASDFLIGSRSLNYWLTAMAAHASDMSSWLFMGFPVIIFIEGFFYSWLAIGLCIFMFLNWLLIAPKIRVQTERYNSLTFSSFFESHFHDTSGMIRIFTAIISLIFYSIYISAGIIGLGYLVHSLFGINYFIAISVGILVIIPYLFIGGYTTLAWIDLFQALFLLVVIVAVPIIVFPMVGGWEGIREAAELKNIPLSMIPNTSPKTLWNIFFLICGWGIGYFGQPHIITKFMGIRNVSHIKKSMSVGMSWQIIALGSAALIGLLAIAYFPQGIQNNELIFVQMVKETFPSIIGAFILCAVLGATISTMDSQILVLASSLTEDFYKRIFRKNATSKELLWITRLFILLVTLFAYIIAFFKIGTIYSLVFYAWSGLGSAFGPLLFFSLYSKTANKYGAWAGIVVGGGTALIWPLLNPFFPIDIPNLVPGFLLSSCAIFVVSWMTNEKTKNITYK